MKEIKLIMLLVFLSAVAFKGYSQEIEDKAKQTSIYPNPLLGDKFFVKSDLNLVKIEVVNVIGKVVNRTENRDNFELHELQVYIGKCEKGMYFVKVTFDDNKSIIKKLLVK